LCAGGVIDRASVLIGSTKRRIGVFAAKPGAVSGSVQLVTASVARRAFYEWRYSIDGGKTWVTSASTLQTKTTVAGLTVGSTVMFRYRGATRTGEGDWSQPTSLLVR
jgi:hypothetical protein